MDGIDNDPNDGESAGHHPLQGGVTGAAGDASFPPAGWVGRDEACRMFGVSWAVWKRWCREGRVRCGKAVRRPAGGRCKIYPVGELERLMGEMRERHLKLPDGFVGRDEAMRMFGATPTTWKRWQRAGRVPLGEWARVPGKRPRVRAYALDELRRLREEFEKLGRPYADPDLPGCYRVPVMSFSTTVCEAIVDAGDLPRVAGKRWNWMPRNDGANPAVVLAAPGDLSNPSLQRVILGLEGSTWRIAHANGDPLDCRRANLIIRNPSESSAAARKAATHRGEPCTSRFKGVHWEETRGKWRAIIQKDAETRFLGRFDDEIAAAEAYDEAARELFGEHARLNFPDGIDAALARAA
jgi:hypothetical protein